MNLKKVKLLHLPLKAKWYRMQESGEKTEEYRELSPYWCKRIYGCSADIDWCHMIGARCGGCSVLSRLRPKDYTHVLLRNGYTQRCIVRRIKSITIGRGHPEWGAPTDRDVFIIKHEKELSPFYIAGKQGKGKETK